MRANALNFSASPRRKIFQLAEFDLIKNYEILYKDVDTCAIFQVYLLILKPFTGTSNGIKVLGKEGNMQSIELEKKRISNYFRQCATYFPPCRYKRLIDFPPTCSFYCRRVGVIIFCAQVRLIFSFA